MAARPLIIEGNQRSAARSALRSSWVRMWFMPWSRRASASYVQETLDLYEARLAIERECLRLALERATPEQIEEARCFLAGSRQVAPDTPVRELVAPDEDFHLRIAAMAHNAELTCLLENLNQRIRFVRWLAMERVGRESTQRQHQQLLDALAAGDGAAAQHYLGEHIGLRREQVVEAISRGLARIYLADEAPLR